MPTLRPIDLGISDSTVPYSIKSDKLSKNPINFMEQVPGRHSRESTLLRTYILEYRLQILF